MTDRLAEIERWMEGGSHTWIQVQENCGWLVQQMRRLSGELEAAEKHVAILREARASSVPAAPQAPQHPELIDPLLVERVEEIVGMGAGAWDMVDARTIMLASYNVLRAAGVSGEVPPPAAPQSPAIGSPREGAAPTVTDEQMQVIEKAIGILDDENYYHTSQSLSEVLTALRGAVRSPTGQRPPFEGKA